MQTSALYVIFICVMMIVAMVGGIFAISYIAKYLIQPLTTVTNALLELNEGSLFYKALETGDAGPNTLIGPLTLGKVSIPPAASSGEVNKIYRNEEFLAKDISYRWITPERCLFTDSARGFTLMFLRALRSPVYGIIDVKDGIGTCQAVAVTSFRTQALVFFIILFFSTVESLNNGRINDVVTGAMICLLGFGYSKLINRKTAMETRLRALTGQILSTTGGLTQTPALIQEPS